ncbi:MAG: hypothetical protein GF383_08340 [Candidatus Lokiarchaeota archaeon]|nr:hypothetical protein [Candidatus Lokiarchaeota archaeon]MBD3340362.1 hypothetical protein [Candidatus Lokiarchaeota archaeon]
MENVKIEDNVKKITGLILKNKQKMIREEDLVNLCGDTSDFNQIIGEVYENLLNVGMELISTKFLEQKYYVLTSEGKDDDITASQYGTLALVLAICEELNENVLIDDLKEIFSEVWTSDIEFLFEKDLIRKLYVEDLEIIKVTPLGKATLKNLISDLSLKKLLDVFKENQK